MINRDASAEATGGTLTGSRPKSCQKLSSREMQLQWS